LKPFATFFNSNAIYEDTATYGHFNSCLFPWEDGSVHYKELRKAAESYAN
jgi:S-adenosylmethionine synthetase